MKIFRLFIILSVMFIIAAGTYAQNTQIGIIGGINMASLNMEDEGIDIKNVIGMGIGGVLDFGFSENISWCFEPMYLQKGTHTKVTEDDFTMEQKLKFSYIEVPVFLKVRLGSGIVRPYVLAGANVGLLLSANAEIMGANIKHNIKNDMSSIDYGLAIGGGISIAVGNYILFLEGRYNAGLIEIFKSSGGIVILNEDGQIAYQRPKNQGTQIMTGFCISLED